MIFRGSRGSRVICRKEAAGLVLAGPVAGDDESLSIQNPAVGIDGIAFFQERFEGTVGNDRMFMAQADELLIVVEDGVGVREGGPGVDLCVVGVDHDPGGAGGEAGICRIVPLHGGAGVVAADSTDALHHFFGGEDLLFRHILPISVDLLYIPAVLKGREGSVGHSQLFALVDVGRPLLHVQAGGKHFGGEDPPAGAVVSETGDHAGLVMVVPVQAAPGLPFQLQLPLVEDLADAGHPGLSAVPFADQLFLHDTVGVFKVEDHTQLRTICRRIFFCLIDRDTAGLTDRQEIVFRQDFPIHFLQKLVDAGTVDDVRTEIPVLLARRDGTIRETLVLTEKTDYIHAEAVDSLLAPPCHHVIDFTPHLRIFPIEIRLFFGKKMQVIHAGLFAVFPGGTGETGAPVIGLSAVAGLFPDIKVPIGIVL